MRRYIPALAVMLMVAAFSASAADGPPQKLRDDAVAYSANFKALMADADTAFDAAQASQQAGNLPDACTQAKIAAAKFADAKSSTLAIADEVEAAGDKADADGFKSALPYVESSLDASNELVTQTCKA